MFDPAPRRRAGWRLVPCLLLALGARPLPSADLVLEKAAVQVFFSPRGGAQAALVAAIAQARTSILVQAYSFTSAPIAGALKAAHDRGVAVRAILDKSQRTERYSGLTYLVRAGIPTWIDAAHPLPQHEGHVDRHRHRSEERRVGKECSC